MTYRQKWHGRKMSYPAGVMAGPGCFHQAPTFMAFDEDTTVVWEHNSSNRRRGWDPWSCLELAPPTTAGATHV